MEHPDCFQSFSQEDVSGMATLSPLVYEKRPPDRQSLRYSCVSATFSLLVAAGRCGRFFPKLLLVILPFLVLISPFPIGLNSSERDNNRQDRNVSIALPRPLWQPDTSLLPKQPCSRFRQLSLPDGRFCPGHHRRQIHLQYWLRWFLPL
jgi:hypothetical protein